MLEEVRKALSEAIIARVKDRLEVRKGQKHIAEEFGLTQADVSLFATGQWHRMTLDKMMRIAQALRIGMSGPVEFVPEGDAEFSVSLARIKEAVAGEAEKQAESRLAKLKAGRKSQPVGLVDD